MKTIYIFKQTTRCYDLRNADGKLIYDDGFEYIDDARRVAKDLFPERNVIVVTKKQELWEKFSKVTESV